MAKTIEEYLLEEEFKPNEHGVFLSQQNDGTKFNIGFLIREYAKQCIIETIEICDAHSESGCFDKEGALSNSLSILNLREEV